MSVSSLAVIKVTSPTFSRYPLLHPEFTACFPEAVYNPTGREPDPEGDAYGTPLSEIRRRDAAP
jgi:hypothetical protein